MNRTSINKNISNNRIYSDTISLNFYNRHTNKNNDDSHSICVKNNNSTKKLYNENLKTTNSKILNNLSITQYKSKNDNQKQINNLTKTKSQNNLSQSLINPLIKQFSKSTNSKQQNQNSKSNNKNTIKTQINNTKNENNFFSKKTNIKQNTSTNQTTKITPKNFQSTQPIIIKSNNQPTQTIYNKQEKELNTKSQNIIKEQTNNNKQELNHVKNNENELYTNNSIIIKNPKNIDNYTEYNNSYIECINNESRYIIKPEYVIFQKAKDYKSYYGVEQVKLSIIDKNQNTLSATTITPILITTKEINLYTGTIEKTPSKEKDIVNKKYVDEEIMKITENDKINKHISKLAEQMNKNIDAINLINQRITKINNNVSVNLKELNQKIYNNQNVLKDEIQTDISNNSFIIKNLTANEITVNKLIMPETFEHVKFDNYIDCNNISLHNIECMNNGISNSLEIKLENGNNIHIFDDDNNFSFRPYSGIIETDNGLTIQKYGIYDNNATKITSEDIMTKRIQLSNIDENGYETIILIQPFNIEGHPKLQIAMKCGENEEIIYLP